jgi:hypothetical protein
MGFYIRPSQRNRIVRLVGFYKYNLESLWFNIFDGLPTSFYHRGVNSVGIPFREFLMYDKYT